MKQLEDFQMESIQGGKWGNYSCVLAGATLFFGLATAAVTPIGAIAISAGIHFGAVCLLV